jgi:hypothetical protein
VKRALMVGKGGIFSVNIPEGEPLGFAERFGGLPLKRLGRNPHPCFPGKFHHLYSSCGQGGGFRTPTEKNA